METFVTVYKGSPAAMRALWNLTPLVKDGGTAIKHFNDGREIGRVIGLTKQLKGDVEQINVEFTITDERVLQLPRTYVIAIGRRSIDDLIAVLV